MKDLLYFQHILCSNIQFNSLDLTHSPKKQLPDILCTCMIDYNSHQHNQTYSTIIKLLLDLTPLLFYKYPECTFLQKFHMTYKMSYNVPDLILLVISRLRWLKGLQWGPKTDGQYMPRILYTFSKVIGTNYTNTDSVTAFLIRNIKDGEKARLLDIAKMITFRMRW